MMLVERSILSYQKMEKDNNGVRKGAWTKEEDVLLRDCIHTYGEGRWHLVPLRAGLNRCRKSCRLRWLNYLRPNLNRGFFTKDEVDLIVRLHKLLGNRWSLIAGRLPRRTANDVKNFWNSHISKRPPPAGENHRGKAITDSNIVRPRPRTFSTSQPPAWSAELTRSKPSSSSIKPSTTSQAPLSSASLSVAEANDRTNSDRNPDVESRASLQEDLDECMRWWGDLFETMENGERNPFLFSDDAPRVTESAIPRGIGDLGSYSADQEGALCAGLSLDGDIYGLELGQFIDQSLMML